MGWRERGVGLLYYALFLYHYNMSLVYRRAAARLLGGERELAQAALAVLEELERLGKRETASAAGELLSAALRTEEPERAARSAAELAKLLRSALGV